MVPTEVPTQMSTISFGSVFNFFAGGGLPLSSDLIVDEFDEFDVVDAEVPLLALELLLLDADGADFWVQFNDDNVELFI